MKYSEAIFNQLIINDLCGDHVYEHILRYGPNGILLLTRSHATSCLRILIDSFWGELRWVTTSIWQLHSLQSFECAGWKIMSIQWTNHGRTMPERCNFLMSFHSSSLNPWLTKIQTTRLSQTNQMDKIMLKSTSNHFKSRVQFSNHPSPPIWIWIFSTQAA